MCLYVKEDYPIQKNKSIRYKILEFFGGQYMSPYRGDTIWETGKLNCKKKTPKHDPFIDAAGYHVHTTLENARVDSKDWKEKILKTGCNKKLVIAKVECSSFVAGGTFPMNELIFPCEIWRKVKMLEIVE